MSRARDLQGIDQEWEYRESAERKRIEESIQSQRGNYRRSVVYLRIQLKR